MDLPILCGVETEYGLTVEGQGAEEQIDNAMALVRSYPGRRLAFKWDYSLESPRADLRGFRLEQLAQDPLDAQFDRTPRSTTSADIRSDLLLPNGARFYNDHGHPEYATPEAWSAKEASIADKAGEDIVWMAAKAFEGQLGRRVGVYKNNTDFHGASYGCHESYLAPRRLGFAGLFPAVLPMLISRQVLTAAGKVGRESGDPCDFQISQRADFFVEPANAETLYRRPIFNTRDEPHGNPAEFIRLHVISGDACMMTGATARKLGLVKLAIMLASIGEAPLFRIADPVRAFQQISRGPFSEGRIELEGGSWTTPRSILESYMDTAERLLELDHETADLLGECRALLEARFTRPDEFARSVDWAAKLRMIEEFRDQEGLAWSDPFLQSLDLAYSSLDPEEGLFPALISMGLVEPGPDEGEIQARAACSCEPTRALARGAAVRFAEDVKGVNWSSLTFETAKGRTEVELPPDRIYSEDLMSVENVEAFIALLQEP
jgi:Pup amidohydrolase